MDKVTREEVNMSLDMEQLNKVVKQKIDKEYKKSIAEDESQDLDDVSVYELKTRHGHSAMAVGVRMEVIDPELESVVTSVHDSILGFANTNELKKRLMKLFDELLSDDILTNLYSSKGRNNLKSFKFVLGHDCVPFTEHFD